MRRLLSGHIIFVSLAFFSFTTYASAPQLGPLNIYQANLIFPPENRLEAYQVSNPLIQQAMRATAGMVYQNILEYNPKTHLYHYNAPNFSERTGACTNHPYSQQPAPILCTGFLIGPNTLVTAGHCQRQPWDCSNNVWVFDYALQSPKQTSIETPERNVYRCSRVVQSVWDPENKIDFAVIELDRMVLDRRPLPLGEGYPQLGQKVFMPGHGGGVPLKVTAEGEVIGNAHPHFFQASLDALGGNSGSPVINLTTGEVEGLLVRGGNAPEWNEAGNGQEQSCRTEYVCDEQCTGVEITRAFLITSGAKNQGQQQ